MTKKCQQCESERVIFVQGHGKDLNYISAPYLKYEHDGYLPDIPNVGGGDDIEVNVCLECGQVQGKWPVSDACIFGFKDDSDLRGFEPKQIKQWIKEYDVWDDTDVNRLFERMMKHHECSTVEEVMECIRIEEEEANELAAEAKKREEERAKQIKESLARIRGTNQYYKLKGDKHFNKEALMDPDVTEITQAIKPSVKQWFDDNNIPFHYEEEMGDWGALTFAVIEEKMAFMNYESKGHFR